MPDYSKGKIYKLMCNETGLTYIGSTVNTFSKRKGDHKRSYKQWLKGEKCNRGYYTSFEILKNENYDMILIENYPCNDKNELHARERYWIENTECVNKVIPTRTRAEWRELNKEGLHIKRKLKVICECGLTVLHDTMASHKRTQVHQDRVKNIFKEVKGKVEMCECGVEVTKRHMSRHIKSTLHNDKMGKSISNKIQCECGSEVSKDHIIRHKKSNIHLEYLSNLNV